MKQVLFALVVALSVVSAGCATAFTKVVNGTTIAIADVAKLQCGAPGALAAPACLDEAHYAKVNADLLAAAQAEKAYADIQAGVAAAKGQSTVGATRAIVDALLDAVADIEAGVGAVSSTAENDIKQALAKFGLN